MAILKKQGVAWIITAVMIVAAIGIGFARAPGGSPTPGPGLVQGPGTFPSYVRDDARVLSDATERTLYERNLRLYENHGVVIGVVTCNGQGYLADYAYKLIGQMGLQDYDMLVVLDIRNEDYLFVGVEGYFTAEDCDRYAWDYMEAPFAAGDYDRAVLDMTEMLEAWYGANFR